jgi:predicted DNA-binding protein (MmcQ/YjbR family)
MIPANTDKEPYAMTVEEILTFCLRKKASYVDYPFGEVPICLKVRGRIFAQIYPKLNDARSH